MASAKIYSADGKAGSSVELSAAIFDVAMNGSLVHQVATALRNNCRQGNHETKTRGEISGGGKKPFRQKGTGNARQGSIREPQMRGGGTVFGPHKRSYRQETPVKMKRKALCCVLSDRARNDQVRVIEGLDSDAVKTAPMMALFKNLAIDGRKTLLITGKCEPNVVKSASNVARLKVSNAADVNALDVLDARTVILTQDALPALEARLS